MKRQQQKNKDLILLVKKDREKLEQEKAALRDVVGALGGGDKMTLIKLNTINQCIFIIDKLLNYDFKALEKMPLKITTHGGKLTGINSLSTLKTHNNLCIKNGKNKRSVCFHCYVNKYLKYYSQLEYTLLYNTLILKYTNLSKYNTPLINANIFRLESFSDLQNKQHLKNLIKIVKYNNTCLFSLWTKNYEIIKDYIKQENTPKNLNIIISSFYLNKAVSNGFINLLKSYNHTRKNQIKTFTVYTQDFIKENNIKINCGARSCLKCGLCYSRKNVSELNEILK